MAARARLPEKLVLDAARETAALFHERWRTEKKNLPLTGAVVAAIDVHVKKVPIGRAVEGLDPEHALQAPCDETLTTGAIESARLLEQWRQARVCRGGHQAAGLVTRRRRMQQQSCRHPPAQSRPQCLDPR